MGQEWSSRWEFLVCRNKVGVGGPFLSPSTLPSHTFRGSHAYVSSLSPRFKALPASTPQATPCPPLGFRGAHRGGEHVLEVALRQVGRKFLGSRHHTRTYEEAQAQMGAFPRDSFPCGKESDPRRLGTGPLKHEIQVGTHVSQV